ncbi:MAG: TonB-dependent receptor, partial [Burkholderiaceae bacterium]|nr:TonB-dependent receptor [Burkholderiaceae bacterium]
MSIASIFLARSALAVRAARPPFTPSVLALALLGGSLAQAQPAASADTALTLGTVSVSSQGGPLAARSVLSSVTVVPAERLESSLAANNWQLFEQVPGTLLTYFNQGTTSGKLSFRGFNGEGEINAVKLLIDGVPSNSNDGNMPYIDLAPRLDVESLEVVKGTNDPRYGLHNIAGNVNIATRRGGDYRIARVGAGSFGTQDLQAALGIGQDGFTQNYALAFNDSQGHRDHSDARNVALSGKWFLNSPDGLRHLGLIARLHQGTAQEAGYLTRAQRQAQPWQSPSYNATDEDRRQVAQVAVQGQMPWGAKTTLNAQVYANQLDDRRFVRFSATAAQQERFVAETQVGASATATWRAGATALGELTVVSGMDTERQDNRSERYTTAAQVRSAQTRDQQFDFNISGAFVQALLKPSARLTLTPALRVDQVSGSYTNALNGRTYRVNDYGLIQQPKFSAVYAWSPAASVYGNAGR